jgi:indole-3-glycerol phosphate synthase
MTILDRILETKREEGAQAKQRRPEAELQAAIQRAAPPRDFYAAVSSRPSSGVHLIAEHAPYALARMLRMSPSATT